MIRNQRIKNPEWVISLAKVYSCMQLKCPAFLLKNMQETKFALAYDALGGGGGGGGGKKNVPLGKIFGL